MIKKTAVYKTISQIIGLGLILGLLLGCGSPTPSPPASTKAAPTPTPATTPSAESDWADSPGAEGLSEEETATLGSLEKIDDYPLYTMRYYAPYDQWVTSWKEDAGWAKLDPTTPQMATSSPAWACSLFAALGDSDHMLYGRNFDWQYSPALLLFTDPADGYASVSMVDIAYLGLTGDGAGELVDLPINARQRLLDAPFLPFDGMNERGLAVGMAAVPPGNMHPDPDKETIGSLGVIREMLDRASTVEEAVDILDSFNIDMGGGPPLHYLIADQSGRSALVEFYQGQMVVIPNETPWHQATNFLRASVEGSPEGQCWRYDKIFQILTEADGGIRAPDALDLLEDVSQDNTQWSVVYEMSASQVQVVMGRKYDEVHTFPLNK